MSCDMLHVHTNALCAPFFAYVHIPALSAGLMFPGKVAGQHSSVFSHRHEVLHVCISLCIRGHACWPVTLRGFSVSHLIYLSKGYMHRHMGHGLTQFCLVPACPCLYVFLCMCVHGDMHTWKHHRQCLWGCVHYCRALGSCRPEHDSACLRMAQSHVCMHAWVQVWGAGLCPDNAACVGGVSAQLLLGACTWLRLPKEGRWSGYRVAPGVFLHKQGYLGPIGA